METKKKVRIVIISVVGLAVALASLHFIVNGLNIQTIFRSIHGG